jgi:Berberine and berberine like
VERATKGFGRNAERLIKAKRHYDPDNVFRSAIPLPVGRSDRRARAAANARKAHASEDA